MSHSHKGATLAGVLVAIGIIFGDIGTSCLYVMKAIIGNRPISEELVLGGVSCIFWTLTFQTTLKYVILTLRADNKGEGGIFSLYALIKRRIKKAKWMLFPAMIGGCTLLADGIITPSISISSAVEGLLPLAPNLPTVLIVITILSVLFFIQQFGTSVLGRAFGPMMFIWFTMILIVGGSWVLQYPNILGALNPTYAINLLTNYPKGFWLLGAVFLCTTGAEALYSDLGHCGRENIRVSWIYVKFCLIINYLGQSAWLLTLKGQTLTDNPFYAIMPDWFRIIGVVIATLAAIIASQALISGSFTLISEAILLNLWPKSRIKYPSNLKGQIYIPGINRMLWAGCVCVMLYFQKSEHMEAAYGLAITLTMLMTTFLLFNYLYLFKYNLILTYGTLIFYTILELGFLFANSEKFLEGGWISLVMSFSLFMVMYIWHNSFTIRNKGIFRNDIIFDETVRNKIRAVSKDSTIPKYATNLVYLTSNKSLDKIEDKILYSILNMHPKRADIYWFVHVTTVNDPYTREYKVDILAEDDIVWIEFRLGFREQPRINLLFRKVVDDLRKNGEVNVISRYPSLESFGMTGDFRFVILERYLPIDLELKLFDNFILQSYFFLKRFTLNDGQYFGLQTSSVTVEKVPLSYTRYFQKELKRVYS